MDLREQRSKAGSWQRKRDHALVTTPQPAATVPVQQAEIHNARVVEGEKAPRTVRGAFAAELLPLPTAISQVNPFLSKIARTDTSSPRSTTGRLGSHLSDITAGKVGGQQGNQNAAKGNDSPSGGDSFGKGQPKGERERQRIRFRGLNLGQLGPDVRTDFRAVLGVPRGSPKSPSKSATHC